MSGRATAATAVEIEDAKRAAVQQWTADPCGANVAAGEPGSHDYFENLVRERFEYGPWMPDSLGYDETCGLRRAGRRLRPGDRRLPLRARRRPGDRRRPDSAPRRARAGSSARDGHRAGDRSGRRGAAAVRRRELRPRLQQRRPPSHARHAARPCARSGACSSRRRGADHRLQPQLIPLLADPGAAPGDPPRRPRPRAVDVRGALAAASSTRASARARSSASTRCDRCAD